MEFTFIALRSHQPAAVKAITPPLNMTAIEAAMAVVNKHQLKNQLSPTSITAQTHAREMQFMRAVSPDHHHHRQEDHELYYHSSSGHTSHANSFSTCSPPHQQKYVQTAPHQYHAQQQEKAFKFSRYHGGGGEVDEEGEDGDLSSLSSAEEDCTFGTAASSHYYEQQQGRVSVNNARFQTSYPQHHQQQYANHLHGRHASQEYSYGHDSTLVW